MKKQFKKSYEDIISLENLFAAWQEFITGKRNKKDVQEFARRLADNIVQLHQDLASFQYKHGGYKAFKVSDPKPRDIHKAPVRDRIVHYAVYRQLYPFFDKSFTSDSFSCRIDKGTHKARSRFMELSQKVSCNHTKTAWVLKCDIKKFFASIDHETLIQLLANSVSDLRVMLLLQEIIGSFCTPSSLPEDRGGTRGLPLGNLTSQLFCNIYLNQLDRFVKHKLKIKYYIRYADDFVLLHNDRGYLEQQIPRISEFLSIHLKLSLHPNKTLIQTFSSGLDFLGWVYFPTHQVVRTSTKRRMFKIIQVQPTNPALQSYLGLLKWGNAYKLQMEVRNLYGLMGGRTF